MKFLKEFVLLFLVFIALAGIVQGKGGGRSSGGGRRSGSSGHRSSSSSSSSSGGGFWSKIFGGGSSKSSSPSSPPVSQSKPVQSYPENTGTYNILNSERGHASHSNPGHSVPSAPPEPSINKIQTKESPWSSEPVGNYGWKNPYSDLYPPKAPHVPDIDTEFWKKYNLNPFSQGTGFKPEVIATHRGTNQHPEGSHHVSQSNSLLQGSANYPTNYNNFPSGPNHPPQMSQPFVPSQTISIPSQATSYQQPGIGQVAKEAIVHATINRALNSVLNGSPYQHHHHDFGPIYSPSSSPLLSTSNGRPSTSDVTINNYYGEPSPVVPLNAPESALATSSTEAPILSTEAPISSTTTSSSSSSTSPSSSSSSSSFPSSSTPSSPSSFSSSYTLSDADRQLTALVNLETALQKSMADRNVFRRVSILDEGYKFYKEAKKEKEELEKRKLAGDKKNTTETLMNFNSNGRFVFGKLIRSKDDDGSQTDLTSLVKPRYNISKEKIENLTETLFNMEEYRLDNFILYNLQEKINNTNITDRANQVMLYVDNEISNFPTIKSLIDLYDNYEMNSTIKENRTDTMRSEEYYLLDKFMNTRVMKTAMNWLADHSYIIDDESEKIDALHHIWFTKHRGSTSGFERIFMAEIYPGETISGAQNWIYFDHLQKLGGINYMGYTDKLIIKNTKTKLIKVNLEIKGIVVTNRTMLIGTSPELEMALYTVCFFTRPNDYCPVSLGQTKFNIYTHNYQIFGKNPIDFGYLSF